MTLCVGNRYLQRSPYAKILFILEGECQITLKGVLDEKLNPRDILILPIPCQHTYSHVAGNRDVRVHTFGLFFKKSFLENPKSRQRNELNPVLNVLMETPRVIPSGFDLELSHLVTAFRREQENRILGYKLQSRNLALSMLVQLARKLNQTEIRPLKYSRSKKHLVEEAKSFMSKALSGHISLERVAWHVNLSEEHLARVFKAETGTTVMNYLRELRIDTAKTMLLSSNESTKTLSKHLGFTSVSVFCRTFKKATGQTPLAYRSSYPGKNR